MDFQQRIDITFAEVQATFERHIACDPDDQEAIDNLWEVMALRWEHEIENGFRPILIEDDRHYE